MLKNQWNKNNSDFLIKTTFSHLKIRSKVIHENNSKKYLTSYKGINLKYDIKTNIWKIGKKTGKGAIGFVNLLMKIK